MPLLDHFRPPLSSQRHWESFHAAWAGSIADALNERWLPEGYFAEEQVHPSARVEIDVATFQEGQGAVPSLPGGGVGVTAVPRVWSPPAPMLKMPAVFPDGFETLVFRTEGGPTLVAAIELVSPSNKDRPEHRRAFVTKCASYLYQGISLIIVDVVSTREANLHDDLVGLMGRGREYLLSPSSSLYAIAYRPARRDTDEWLDIWPARLALGGELPTLPLHLGGDLYVPIDLEAAYEDVCRRRRLA